MTIGTDDLRRFALIGLQAEKARIENIMSELASDRAPRSPRPVNGAAPPQPARRKMSAAARKRIGDATRKRWAAARKAKVAAAKS